MEISSLLSGETGDAYKPDPSRSNGVMVHNQSQSPQSQAMLADPSEPRPSAKNVTFEYLLNENSSQRARLPMRVNIYPHDGTESIIATVKNFYGLYDGNGVSFEDRDGNTLIARFENFADKQTVYVRVIEDTPSNTATPSHTTSPRRPRLGPAFELSQLVGHSISRPSSRATKKRSASPVSNSGLRSNSVSTIKSRAKKSRMGSVYGDIEYDSDSDIGNASVTSSRRGKSDVVASAEISVDNIVEGGRRKRARFDSSELPLFVPSQLPLPGSISSVSPQRKTGPNAAASPYQYSNPILSYSVLPSPQSFSQPDSAAYNGYRVRNSGHFNRPSISGPGGILPTPDPTVGSVISDEDVALQLMRLGDASNYSTHGRTSTSTLDDALSGKAAASSSEDSDDDGSGGEENGLPHGHISDYSGDEEDIGDGSFRGSDGLIGDEGFRQIKKARTNSKSSKSSKSRKWKVKTGSAPLSPTSLASLKPGQQPNLNFQHFQQPMAEDEEDLSTKPRCQRCRKSKKGCDRQRPCGRCKDAGIGVEGCVSEDEGNGRKGRYGRHMGVPIKKLGDEGYEESMSPISSNNGMMMMMGPPPLLMSTQDKKKRKR